MNGGGAKKKKKKEKKSGKFPAFYQKYLCSRYDASLRHIFFVVLVLLYGLLVLFHYVYLTVYYIF